MSSLEVFIAESSYIPMFAGHLPFRVGDIPLDPNRSDCLDQSEVGLRSSCSYQLPDGSMQHGKGWAVYIYNTYSNTHGYIYISIIIYIYIYSIQI